MSNKSTNEEYQILDLLKENSIFSVRKLEDGTYDFMEECDSCLTLNLTKDQVTQLTKELLMFISS